MDFSVIDRETEAEGASGKPVKDAVASGPEATMVCALADAVHNSVMVRHVTALKPALLMRKIKRANPGYYL
jgi:hypothetical protein